MRLFVIFELNARRNASTMPGHTYAHTNSSSQITETLGKRNKLCVALVTRGSQDYRAERIFSMVPGWETDGRTDGQREGQTVGGSVGQSVS